MTAIESACIKPLASVDSSIDSETMTRRHMFLDSALDDFAAAIDAMPGARGERVDFFSGSVQYRVFSALSSWMKDPDFLTKSWDANVRTVNALRAGVNNGSIALKNRDDLMLLHFAISIKIEQLPQVVEHYVDRSEFAELLSVLKGDRDRQRTEAGPWAGLPSANARVKMRRLYDYDMDQIGDVHKGESRHQRDDENYSSLDLPLEIRAVFAGLNEDVTDAEYAQDDIFSALSKEM